MTKSTRALSGAAKDTFLEGMVRSALGEDSDARDRLLKELTQAIASLRVRVEAERGRRAISDWTERVLSIAEEAAPAAPAAPAALRVVQETIVATEEAEPPSAPSQATFDPYDPNVIVVVRTKGREAALKALAQISHESDLRLLAHEQQLGVPADASGLPAIRDAIVTAAERRIANRRAAGS
jgi:hypothetical protein